MLMNIEFIRPDLESLDAVLMWRQAYDFILGVGS
jgi:hypothetical protein